MNVAVTGANRGLGLEVTRALARDGHAVVLACRDPDAAARAIDLVRAGSPDATLQAVHLDLADLASVHAAARALGGLDLDVLVLNAGVMATPPARTRDGFELQLGTNLLGHFALARLLLPALGARPAARVVTVSSAMHRLARDVRREHLTGERACGPIDAYDRSKLGLLRFHHELARRLAVSYPSVIAVACHPGYAATDLQDRGPRLRGARCERALWKVGNAVVARTAEEGARHLVAAVTREDAVNGAFLGPRWLGWRGRTVPVASSAAARDAEACRRLWRDCADLTRVDLSDGG